MPPDEFAIYLQNFNDIRSKISPLDGLWLRRIAGAKLEDDRARAGLFETKRNLTDFLTALDSHELLLSIAQATWGSRTSQFLFEISCR